MGGKGRVNRNNLLQKDAKTGILFLMKLKELIWVCSSKKDLIDLSESARQDIGHGLYIAQTGGQCKSAKVLTGFGSAGIIEILATDNAGTYRAVYTVTMPSVIFVLHVFQKKSKHGIATPKQEIELVKSRLKLAQEIYKERLKL